MSMPASPDFHVVVDEDEEISRVDPETGDTEIPLEDGSVIIRIGHGPPKVADDDDEDDWIANLAEDMGEGELGQLAEELLEAIDADDRSRAKWLEDTKKGLDLLGLELENPKSGIGESSAPLEGMSTVRNPLLLEAVLRGWANATAELLPAAGPMKIKDDGSSPPAPMNPAMAAANVAQEKTEDDLAEALAADMNYYLTTTAVEYYPDTKHMLLWGVHFRGCGIKKVYRCPMRRRPVSESVDPKDFIVSDATKDLRACERITHVIPMRPSVMKRMKLIGAYRDIPETQPTPSVSVVETKVAMIQGVSPRRDRPEDEPYTVMECQCELDLDQYAPAEFKGTGIRLPYIVTLEKDSRQILALRRDWLEDDEDALRKRLYVRYPYVPGPGFYGTGLLNILGNITTAATAATREGLDAGMFASFPGFLYVKQIGRQLDNNFRVGPGQGAPFEVDGGADIRTQIMPIPYKDATPGLMAMLKLLMEMGQRIGNTAELQVGEGRTDIPVGTIMATIEQATKIMAATHKGMHGAQAEEFGLLIDLFREHPEDFWRGRKKCAKAWDKDTFLQALDDCELVPVADPNTPSHLHRIARCVGLKQVQAQNPSLYDAREVDTVVLKVMGWDNPERFFVSQDASAAPPPDLKGQAALMQAQTAQNKVAQDAQTSQTDAQLKMAELAAEQHIADTNLERERIIHQHDADIEHRKLAIDEAKLAHGVTMDRASHSLAVGQAVHEAGIAHAAHGLAVGQAQHEAGIAHASHGLAVGQAAHDADLARQQHDLEVAKHQHEARMDVHEALHPPKPATPKPKGKS